MKGKKPGPKTHWTKSMATLKGEITITRQQGRILEGTFKSARATEKFIAVIGRDNKKLCFADEDGFIDGMMIDNDTIECVYRHVSANDSVVAVGVWKRRK